MTALPKDADPALVELGAAFRDIARRAEAIVEPLSGEQLLSRPGSGGWSVTECLEHLNATGWPYVDVFREHMDRARAEGRTGGRPYRPSLKGRFLIWFIGPPARLRVKTPDAFRPAADADPDEALRSFLELQRELDRLVAEAHGLDLNRVRFASPVDPRLALSLGEWFAFQAAHERRHLWQAERVVDDIAG